MTIEELTAFVRAITGAPLPSVPGAGVAFYLEIESMRCEAATNLCLEKVERYRKRHGNEAAESLRFAFETIRTELLMEYPACAALLDPATWPMKRVH